MAACKGCGAPIVFLKTRAGNLIPVDDSETAQEYLREQAEFDPKDQDLIPHHSVCPDADRFRKAKT